MGPLRPTRAARSWGAAGGACLGVMLTGTPWAAIGGMIGGLGAGMVAVTYVTEVMGRQR